MAIVNSALDFLAQKLGHVVKYDSYGNPSWFVPIPKCTSKWLDDSLPDHIHPAFVVNGVVKDRVLIGKFKACALIPGGPTYSIPGAPPLTATGADAQLSQMRAFGSGQTGKTVADSGLILLYARKMGWVPKANNNYSVDYRDGTPWTAGASISVGTKRVLHGWEYTALSAHTSAAENKPDIAPSIWTKGKHIGGTPVLSQVSASVPNGYNTITGSGPMSWNLGNNDHGVAGINELTGNCSEQDYGYRIFDGELQILQDNNAADPIADLSAGSAAWKAILPNLEDDGFTLVAPGTDGTLKWDVSAATGGYPILDTVINIRTTESASRSFKDLTRNVTNVPFVPHILLELGLFPISGDTTQGNVYVRNDAGSEFFPRRGGAYSSTSSAGLGFESCNYARSLAYTSYGARPRFSE
ncbi:MAG: hypothetical protein PHS57_06355 [Alphaproteobacteria bacterium]|nr:hypothetical protein [Alphaproteobacteria bacterium]